MGADWQQMLAILAVASIGLGNLVAIAQTNLKRMLAYSTISHMGFLLLGILAGTDNGYSSAMFYVITYVLMTLGAFGMILLLSRAGFEAEEHRRLQGPEPALEVVRLRDAGHRVLAGGHPAGRRLLRQARRAAGGASRRATAWLVVFAVLMSVVGAFYYLRIVKLMYMDEPAGEITIAPRAATCAWLLSANAHRGPRRSASFPAPLMDLCARAITASL